MFRGLVPLTIPFSNSFYQNLQDIYNLKDVLENEGIIDYPELTLIVKGNEANSTLPIRT